MLNSSVAYVADATLFLHPGYPLSTSPQQDIIVVVVIQAHNQLSPKGGSFSLTLYLQKT